MDEIILRYVFPSLPNILKIHYVLHLEKTRIKAFYIILRNLDINSSKSFHKQNSEFLSPNVFLSYSSPLKWHHYPSSCSNQESRCYFTRLFPLPLICNALQVPLTLPPSSPLFPFSKPLTCLDGNDNNSLPTLVLLKIHFLSLVFKI